MQRAGHTPVAGTGTAASAHGPEASLAALIDDHSAAVYRLARSVVRDSSLADDVTQDTFIKVWKHLDEFRGDGSIRGWILRIAHREAISALRRRRDQATDPDDLDLPVDRAPVSRVVEGRMAYERFTDALDSLDELSRSILVLREVEGLPYDEIAEALDVPVPTVKTRLLRARRRMSTLLEGWRP
ncbi:MAG: RNA polymerase sigma factor [Ilumatobacter sp.]|uniref:RNA polymerase sigma factor n=1 Tax=Ilumatobacter sp. TaxID=1967498 RepID=UPI0026021200|nr:RNA polymerase sigma factor [Ilumatobacter sp.]MDJ0768607.1 RNA polymerase sigma factor [Ilumatobacter sp.]